MNVLFCGDRNVVKGLFLSVLSLLKHTKRALNVYVLTVEYEEFKAIREADIAALREEMKRCNLENSIEVFDITELMKADLPEKNMKTVFTPCCMLRLYADLVPELPEKLLYLDTDVLAYNDFDELYDLDISEYEFAGVLDNYGAHLFHHEGILVKDYINSGVLLLNIEKIRRTELFTRAREMCRVKRMFMPDQSSINKLAKAKAILPRKYNEQRGLKSDTVFRHFTTRVKILPYPHPQTIKPWDEEQLHKTLNCYEFDDILEKYNELKVR